MSNHTFHRLPYIDEEKTKYEINVFIATKIFYKLLISIS